MIIIAKFSISGPPIFVLKFGDQDGLELFPSSNIQQIIFSVDLYFLSRNLSAHLGLENEINLFVDGN